jgi:predicted lipid-binding transport protein (Tim44 family)
LPTPLPPSAATPDPPPEAPKKDSVELLLEGMGEQRLDRPKTTPQSDGEASATYHTEHTVHPSEHPSPEDPATVLLDRPQTPTAIQLRRSLRAPPHGSKNRETAATMLTPSRVGRRMLVAAMAGIMVVVAFFLVLELAIRRMPIAATPFAAPAAQVAPPPVPSAAPAAPPAAVESPAAPISNPPAEAIASTAPPTSATTRARAPIQLVQVPKRHAKPAVSASTSTALPSGDIGEFRTSF